MPDPRTLLRSRNYVGLLVVAAVLGVPVSAAAYGFLALVNYLQKEIFTHLPHGLGFQATPVWWPLPVLAVGGLIAAAAIRYLPGDGGPSPAGGFKMHGAPTPAQLPGVILAALATLIFGAVLGPEMPLILIGGGLVLVFLKLARRDVPEQGRQVLASAGSFAAISTLLGSPILGAFLLMEASGLGGPMLGVVLVPGLLAAGIGTLVFIGLDAWTGLGTFSLAIPGLPHFSRPDVAEFGWAVAIGAVAPFIGWGIRWLARRLHTYAERQPLLLLPLAGLAVAGLAIGYAEATGKSSSDVLFSGQSALGPLIQNSSTYTVGALLLLVLCKGPGLRHLAGQLPRRPDLPGAVHRRGRRHRPVASARVAAGSRDSHGSGRDVGRDAHASADLGAAGHGPAVLRRARGHAAGHRGGRGRLRGRGANRAGRRHRPGDRHHGRCRAIARRG